MFADLKANLIGGFRSFCREDETFVLEGACAKIDQKCPSEAGDPEVIQDLGLLVAAHADQRFAFHEKTAETDKIRFVAGG